MKKEFYPSYIEICSDKIYETSYIGFANFRCGYFADTNCKVQFYADYVSIIDLSNAMKNGKECLERRFVPEGPNLRSTSELKINLMNQNIKTIAELFAVKEIDGFVTKEYTNMPFRCSRHLLKSVIHPYIHLSKLTKGYS